MNLAESIRHLLPPIDPRTPQQIDSDIEDEFAFHLAMLEDAERAAGADEPAAKAIAQRRFGDAAKWRKRCRRIALKERVMLQRINFALTILLMLVVIGVGVQVYMTQRHNTLALQEITSQIGNMRYDAEAAAIETVQNTAASADDTAEEVAAQIDYDLRNVVGIWRLLGDGDVPDQLETLVIYDRSPEQPPGMVKQRAKPWTGFTLEEQHVRFDLLFKPESAGMRNSATLEVTVLAQSDGRQQSHNQARPRVDATWSVLDDDRIAIHLEPLLDTMTADARATLSAWFDKPLHYERVTDAYTDRIERGPPKHVHVVGIEDEPQRFVIPDEGKLSAQDVLRRAGFKELEQVEAQIWQMTDEGPEFEGRLRPEHIDSPKWNVAPIALLPDAVLAVSRRMARDEDESKPKHRGVVYLAGDAQRSGTYNLPSAGDLLVSRLLTAAGVDLRRDDLTVTVRRRFDNDTEETILDVPVSELRDNQSKDIKLKPNDLVTVRENEK